MSILVTGAAGFIGRALVESLLEGDTQLGLAAQGRIVLLDRAFEACPLDARVRRVTGDLTSAAVMQEAVGEGVDLVFHLASVPGGTSEADFGLGMRVNLQGTAALLESLRAQGRPVRFVFASTVGVYGVPLPALVDEDTVPSPTLSYGAEKLAAEILVTEYSRRGFIDGCSLRLPGIVARPSQPEGLLSAFLSDLIRALSARRAFTCPVAPEATTWLMSRGCAIENLLHAGTLDASILRRRRVWLLPVLRASIAELVVAIGNLHGEEVSAGVTYRPDARLQAQFASYPPLRCTASLEAGFRHDGDLQRLVQRALQGQ